MHLPPLRKVLLAVMAVVFLVGLAYVLDVELVLALLGSHGVHGQMVLFPQLGSHESRGFKVGFLISIGLRHRICVKIYF